MVLAVVRTFTFPGELQIVLGFRSKPPRRPEEMADSSCAVIQSMPGMSQGHLKKGLEGVLAKDTPQS